MINLDLILVQVSELALKVGKFQLDEQARFVNESIVEKDFNNLVSFVDIESEKMLVAGLKKIYPEAEFLTEENTTENRVTESTPYWIIDPLDGTTNFVHRLPIFGISIALVLTNEITLGVIYEPVTKELFTAIKENGAFLNHKKIEVSRTLQIQNGLIATGFPYYAFEKTEKYLKTLGYFMQHTRGVRRMGAAAIDLAYVAAGRFDAFYEYNLNPWDVAAGILLVTEAGGKVTTFTGNIDALYGREILASNNFVHQEMKDAITLYFH